MEREMKKLTPQKTATAPFPSAKKDEGGGSKVDIGAMTPAFTTREK
jgi:hypothetical protein